MVTMCIPIIICVKLRKISKFTTSHLVMTVCKFENILYDKFTCFYSRNINSKKMMKMDTSQQPAKTLLRVKQYSSTSID